MALVFEACKASLKVAKCWEGIMSSKKKTPSCFEATPNYLIDNKGLKAAKAKILGKDKVLCTKIQPEDIEYSLYKLANNKQPGPDRCPNKLLKMAGSTLHTILAPFISLGLFLRNGMRATYSLYTN